MLQTLTDQALALSDDVEIKEILTTVCRVSGMGFAALARVTEDRWIACQVLDKIEFGLNPGDELEVATTICDDIRKTCTMVVIDYAPDDPDWRTHPTPILYGFKSYVSLPITLADGAFFGTLCAIDPHRRELRGSDLLPLMRGFTSHIANIIDRRLGDIAN
jgi:GAF domain-containing protein